MPFKKHGRTYDLVLFGATGYTGAYTAEYVSKNLPTDLKWAIAGRSPEKLAKVAADLKELNPDRLQPGLEICSVNDDELAQLAKKTAVLISTVGPYGAHGEPAFKACAENGTHYVDVTGEVPFVARMIRKYDAAAKASGALMFPQSGIESAPADIAAAEVARVIRTELGAKTADVTASLRLKALPSGGTLDTVLSAVDNFSIRELRSTMAPYALSPVPRPDGHRGNPSLLSYLTGVVSVRHLGTLTTSLFGSTNAAQVERTWGLLSSLPGRGAEAYGPNFSFAEYARARNWLKAVQMHWSLAIGGFLLVTFPPFRWLAKRYVFAPGTGPTRENARKDVTEYRAVGKPDTENPTQVAFTTATFRGSMYDLTGILASEAALAILLDDLKLEGGVYTPSLLGPKYIERLGEAGFKYETKLIDA
ncbi:hypothetical protein HMPREF1624_00303 [Sporothrix schenckii ATCC 58251]|uniref:Saccharopine dehydrogenase NADP binding domain-containing protein n=1 Tax=Sporothrix schenckii (strain ATCC 58251 / de Perez 2211183) TaxID=1391915 RepID=U7Q2E1_SPOS1|nr:hypothetical protein HMPREF1624_00303 [Sporothrix schenckii ATCC 58251]